MADNFSGQWEPSVPEQGDGDDTVLVMFDGSETIRITHGTLARRKQIAAKVCELLNESDATLEA